MITLTYWQLLISLTLYALLFKYTDLWIERKVYPKVKLFFIRMYLKRYMKKHSIKK